MTPAPLLCPSLLITGLLASCASGPPTPNPNQTQAWKGVFVNPYPPGSYDHFTADPSYPEDLRGLQNPAALGNGAPTRIDDRPRPAARHALQGRHHRDGLPGLHRHARAFPPRPAGTRSSRRSSPTSAPTPTAPSTTPTGSVHKTNADINKDKLPEGGSFKGAAMPYWMRLSWSGVGMHRGQGPALSGLARLHPHALVGRLRGLYPHPDGHPGRHRSLMLPDPNPPGDGPGLPLESVKQAGATSPAAPAGAKSNAAADRAHSSLM